jgi:hypothetical protein
MKVRVFTKKEWKKKVAKIEKIVEGNLELAYADGRAQGIVVGRKEGVDILAAALYQAARAQGTAYTPPIHVPNELVGKVAYSVTKSWTANDTTRVDLVLKSYLPE